MTQTNCPLFYLELKHKIFSIITKPDRCHGNGCPENSHLSIWQHRALKIVKRIRLASCFHIRNVSDVSLSGSILDTLLFWVSCQNGNSQNTMSVGFYDFCCCCCCCCFNTKMNWTHLHFSPIKTLAEQHVGKRWWPRHYLKMGFKAFRHTRLGIFTVSLTSDILSSVILDESERIHFPC